jgi:hypothetical protein
MNVATTGLGKNVIASVTDITLDVDDTGETGSLRERGVVVTVPVMFSGAARYVIDKVTGGTDDVRATGDTTWVMRFVGWTTVIVDVTGDGVMIVSPPVDAAGTNIVAVTAGCASIRVSDKVVILNVDATGD